ncbi:MAG: anti-sigma-E factor ChrR [Kiloniellaceae bacterium]
MRARDGTPAHHFPEEMLLDYVAGTLAEAPAILVATHLSLCPSCMAAAAEYKALGGDLLGALEPPSPDSDALESASERRVEEEEAPVEERMSGREDALPAPLAAYLGDELAKLAWQFLAPGIEQVALRPRRGAAGEVWPEGGEVLLVRLAPGAAAPRHTHRGIEATVIVQGGFSDETGQYDLGDAWIVDATVTHGPVALPGEDCLCLVYLDAPLMPVGEFHVPSI